MARRQGPTRPIRQQLLRRGRLDRVLEELLDGRWDTAGQRASDGAGSLIGLEWRSDAPPRDPLCARHPQRVDALDRTGRPTSRSFVRQVTARSHVHTSLVKLMRPRKSIWCRTWRSATSSRQARRPFRPRCGLSVPSRWSTTVGLDFRDIYARNAQPLKDVLPARSRVCLHGVRRGAMSRRARTDRGRPAGRRRQHHGYSARLGRDLRAYGLEVHAIVTVGRVPRPGRRSRRIRV